MKEESKRQISKASYQRMAIIGISNSNA